MLTEALEKVLNHQNLTSQEMQMVVREMIAARNPCQCAAFLAGMRAKGETSEELMGLILAMQERMVPVSFSFPVLDIVGTGGDGAHTLNISTASSILAASAGVKIAKHGNRSVSSLCGSADVLEALGIRIELSAEEVKRSVEEAGIGFMYAPSFHPATKALREIRKELKIRTLFNLIGPLLNPARAEYLMIGIADREQLELVAETLLRLGTKRALVFHGSGLDELSCLGPSEVVEVTPQGLVRYTLDPREFGFSLCTLKELQGGSALENAGRMIEAFQGKPSGFADTLALNAGAALYLSGKAASIQEGIHCAQSHLKNESALKLLETWRKSQC